MPSFDSIATQTVRKAEHLEPSFVHAADIEAATKKLKARRKKPNILIFLMDDVPEEERKAVARQVADKIIAQLRQAGEIAGAAA